jgi:hypothetical protein
MEYWDFSYWRRWFSWQDAPPKGAIKALRPDTTRPPRIDLSINIIGPPLAVAPGSDRPPKPADDRLCTALKISTIQIISTLLALIEHPLAHQ